MLNSLGLRMKQLCLLFELPITKVELIQDNKGYTAHTQYIQTALTLIPPAGVNKLCLLYLTALNTHTKTNVKILQK